MKKLFLLLIASLSLNADLPQEEIRVHLTSDQQLEPLYLGQFIKEKTDLTAAYLDELEMIFQFDLNYNGMNKVVARAREKETLLSKKDPKEAFNPIVWKDFGVAQVIKPTVIDRTLSFNVLSVQTGSLKQFPDIPLTGDMAQDRRVIHKSADKIFKALYNKDGIASSRILYCVQQKNTSGSTPWISEVWECDWDGANARQITHEKSYSVTPVFVPADPLYATDRFLYVSYKMGQPKIFIASLKEGKGERFMSLKGNQLLPAVSHKRDKIAFICDAAGRADLFVQSIHPQHGELGKPVQLFSAPNSVQASPTFNPAGNKIAFVSDKDGTPRIYVIPITSSGKASPALITKKNPESSCPAWSPDGKKMAYSARTTGVRQIWIYDFESKEERQLTFGGGNKENPSWAPDSLHLVFNSTDASSSELYLVNLNQPEAVKITKGLGKKHYPSWGIR